ncbi:hypothetical protein HZS_2792, partial [Henneguya salminicola]
MASSNTESLSEPLKRRERVYITQKYHINAQFIKKTSGVVCNKPNIPITSDILIALVLEVGFACWNTMRRLLT